MGLSEIVVYGIYIYSVSRHPFMGKGKDKQLDFWVQYFRAWNFERFWAIIPYLLYLFSVFPADGYPQNRLVDMLMSLMSTLEHASQVLI